LIYQRVLILDLLVYSEVGEKILKKKKELQAVKYIGYKKGKNHHSMLQDPPEPILDASIF
jgi:hypothetical protein